MSQLPHLAHGWAVANLEARITAHVHAWEQARGDGQPLAPEAFPFITISREFGCQGLVFANQLQETLNHRFRPFFQWVAYDRELLDKVATELHLARAFVETVDGQRRNEMSELFDTILNQRVNESIVIRKLAEVIRAIAIHGNAIIVGRGSYLITQDLRNGLHIRLVAPRDWRVHNVAVAHNVSEGEASKLVEENERGRERYIKTFFNCDPTHPFYHDVTIDNSRFNLVQISEIVLAALAGRFGETLAKG